jgi:hypothetical protein
MVKEISMIYRKSMELSDYLNWDHHLFRNATKFMKRFGFFPNFALVSSKTLKGIDAVANAMAGESFQNLENPKEKKSKFESVTGFATDKFSMEFFIDDSLKDREIALIHDTDPYSDEDIPTQDTI